MAKAAKANCRMVCEAEATCQRAAKSLRCKPQTKRLGQVLEEEYPKVDKFRCHTTRVHYRVLE